MTRLRVQTHLNLAKDRAPAKAMKLASVSEWQTLRRRRSTTEALLTPARLKR